MMVGMCLMHWAGWCEHSVSFSEWLGVVTVPAHAPVPHVRSRLQSHCEHAREYELGLVGGGYRSENQRLAQTRKLS